ncbi:ATP-binding protein [Paenibacillus thiaminolyticus]|uniref:ATP-binding protein n=1 Tax=Paenibacillus thiaminolyticus TaxID=49283 RepID=UPI002350FD26|nr:ATP-binding protein [Paenibacillus thiaminolyticus]WCR24866.1 ATP-binding protein [Paenibacillus thiaminolyticus]
MAKINIRPTSAVYATYKRLSYQPWTAIAEFVDNSTQSYFDHREQLLTLPDFKKLTIDILYESKPDGNDILTIIDSAYGMEWEDFERAIILDKVPKNTEGRNEFGMGLKTAACWFGKKWSVTSTQLGSEFGYSATVDVEKLKNDKDDEIDADIFEASPSEHYTIIKIENLNKKLTASRTVWKIKELLSNIYRQDLRSGEVIIRYNGTELTYSDPTIYEEELADGSVERWKRDIKFSVNHEGKALTVQGFIAIRIPASVRDAGFTLMRRGRVIVGGPEKNYRPTELFGDSNSYAYQRLFGELYMDNWPVTQAKDDFDWHTSGLEEQFIENLLVFSKPFRAKAEQIRVRQRIETADVIGKAVDGLQKADVIQGVSITPVIGASSESSPPTVSHPEPDKNKKADKEDEFNNQTNESAIDTGLILTGPTNYETNFEYMNVKYTFFVEFETSNPLSPWVTLSQSADEVYNIKLNMKHTFFKPFIDNKEFSVVMTKLVIAIILAEVEALKISYDGRIEASSIRNKMNKILADLALQS